jgi:hypothetical protein
MTVELTKYIECQARILTCADLDRLLVDLPAVRELSAKISSQRKTDSGEERS